MSAQKQAGDSDPMSGKSQSVVVLIQGIGNNARIWDAQVKALSDEFEVIIADYSGAESIEEMANRVLAQVQAGEFSLVGFSLGGYIALHMVKVAADRIRRLAFISSSPYADTEQATQQRELLMEKAQRDYPSLLREMGQFIVAKDGPNAESAREVLITMGLELGVDEFCRQQRAAMYRADSRDVLGSISCPVRVLCGQEDRVTPVAGNRYLADHIPGATLEVVPGAGHLLPLESPDEVNQFLLQWLQQPAQ